MILANQYIWLPSSLRVDVEPPKVLVCTWVVGSGKTKWKNSPVGCQMGYTVGFDVGVGDGFPFGWSCEVFGG